MAKPGRRVQMRTGREAQRAFNQPPFRSENGGAHIKVFVGEKLVCCYNCHGKGDLSPGMQAHLRKVYYKYAAAVLALGGLLALAALVLL